MKNFLIVESFEQNKFSVVQAQGFIPENGIELIQWPLVDELTDLPEEEVWLQVEKVDVVDEISGEVIGEKTILTVNEVKKNEIIQARQQAKTEAETLKAQLQAEIDFFRAEALAWDGSTWQTREDQHRIIGYIIKCLLMLDDRTKNLDGL